MARIVVPPVLLTTSFVSQHVVNSGVQATLVIAKVWNSDSVSREFHMSFVPDGDGQGDINNVIGTEHEDNIVKAGESRTYREEVFLDPGDDIQCKCLTGGVMSLRLSVLEGAP